MIKDNFLTGYEKFNNLLDNNKIKFNKEIFHITDVQYYYLISNEMMKIKIRSQ